MPDMKCQRVDCPTKFDPLRKRDLRFNRNIGFGTVTKGIKCPILILLWSSDHSPPGKKNTGKRKEIRETGDSP